jgi:predicted glutamine amidotransferase
MCRLLAYDGDLNSQDYKDVLRSFALLGEHGCVPCGIEPGHLDGWGINSSNKKDNIYFRSVYPIKTDVLESVSENIKTYGQTILHIRKATVGKNMLCNTHPFIRSGISFCHNGSIHALPQTSFVSSRHVREGHTDSETFFIRVLDRISGHTGDVSLEDLRQALVVEVSEIKESSEWTALICLLKSQEGIILNYLWNEKHSDSEKLCFRDYYTFYKGTKDNATMFCSEILNVDGFTWEKLDNNTIITIPHLSSLPE